MSYKALMVHVELDGEVDGRIRVAAELARRFEAALIGVSGWAPQPAFVADSNVIEVAPEEIDVQAMSDLLKERGEGFRAAAGAGIAVEWRSAVELPTEVLLREARAADLLIIGSARYSGLRDLHRTVDPGAVLLRAGRPVLFVPSPVTALTAKRIALAWRDTREARRAVQDALPFLRAADGVAVFEVCESGEEKPAQHRLQDVAQYLARHGVNGVYERLLPIDATVSNSLLRFLKSEAVDLVVAGAYGHTRLGEWIFGGITRDLLTSSPVCCLFSH